MTHEPEAAAFKPFTKKDNPSSGDSAKPYGDVTYADPGYQSDKKKRYPIDTAAHVRSAWSYISQSGNAAKYTAQQRESIKARIRTAAKKLKVDLAEPQKAAIEELRGMGGPTPVEEAVVTPKQKTKKGKHRFVGTQHVKSSTYTGAGWAGICIACGRPDSDPDHDGDVDTPGIPDDDAPAPPQVPVAAGQQSWNGQLWPNVTTLPATFTHLTTGGATTFNGLIGLGHSSTVVHERPQIPEGTTILTPAPPVKAFVTELNGKTLVTGPASTFTPSAWEKALSPNENMLWLQGRFVGAEKANRNGAFWSTADLELGEATVKYGPLNWLHEAKHIIGTIADTRLVAHDNATDQPLEQPFIQAASAIWSWIYRDEASVVEMASDSGKLWYSMECISKNVECVGDGGCGRTVAYMDYITGEQACDHMRQRSATRRFADPTFLGGAVIMPPARPGWAEADAQVMRAAASLAEKAFDQAGQPDISASEWEQLMAGVVRFAS
jgi:hypothetical protein